MPNTQVDLERIPPRPWKKYLKRAAIFGLVVGLPTMISAVFDALYVYASVKPISSLSAALHNADVGWTFILIGMTLVNVLTGFVMVFALSYLSMHVQRKCHPSVILLAVFMFALPMWLPYPIEAALAKHIRSTECNGFDGIVTLTAGRSYDKIFPSAEFPPSLGDQEWQLIASQNHIWDFGPIGEDSRITYNFIKRRITVHSTNVTCPLAPRSQPLSFPPYGLSSRDKWRWLACRAHLRLP